MSLRSLLRRGAGVLALAAAAVPTAALPAAALAAPGDAAPPELAGRPFPRTALRPSATLPVGRRADAAAYSPASAPADVDGAASGRVVRIGTGAGASQTLAIPRGKSATIELPADAGDVTVSDPKVADVVLATPRRIQIMGLATGQTDAQFLDGMGRRILHLDIRVDQDSNAAAQTIASLLPDTSIHVTSAGPNLILSGEAASAAEADQAMRLAASFVAQPTQVVNLIKVAGAEQVMLKVRIVEVNRSVLKQLGFDLSAVTGQLGMPQYVFSKSPTYGVNGNFLGNATGGYSLNTTSQAVTSSPFTSLLSGLSTAASAAGIAATAVPTVISQFLTGTGALTGAQTTFAQNAVSGLVGSVTTQVTPNLDATTAGVPYTVTASSAGIGLNNISQFEQRYLAGDTTLTLNQRSWLNAFNTQLNSNLGYNPSNLFASSSSSAYPDHTNPADFVATNRAGSTGLNQANAMIQAFERVGLIRTLAEPNLTAVSGESGHFLVGGEFPVPTSQDNNGRVSVEFKPFGVGLGYTPVVLSGGRISLKISTEVSELTSVGGFTLTSGNTANGTGTSLVVPGLNVRRAETTVELPSGGAMMIAGLLQSQTKETLDSLPGLQQLPILGALFRSRDFQNNQTELVVIVTPYLVKPARPQDLATPADGLKIADDLQTNLLGRLNSGFGKSPPPAQSAAAAGAPPQTTYQGPYGYVVD